VENYVAGFLSQIQSSIARMVPAEIQRIVDVHLILGHAISTSLRKPGAADAENAMSHEAWATELMPAGGERARAVFIDRDGVINENRSDYVKSWDEFKFLDGSLGALARLAQCKLKVVIVSNQSAIGRQRVSREIVEDIHRRMVQQIEQTGGHVDRVLYCPHHPDENCGCRKPRPGLLEQAGRELELDLTRSYLIGDALEDLEAGRTVGCQTLLVRTGRGVESMQYLDRQNESRPVVVDDLKGSVEWIMEREGLPRMDRGACKIASNSRVCPMMIEAVFGRDK
jgi:D-glycero-D-manno-heptose 1,7-bisphosphate phosphatase